MRTCSKCNININSTTDECPLCNTIIKSKEKGEDVFPIIESKYKKHAIIFKILEFGSIFGSIISLFINYTISRKITWSYFVILALVLFWITLLTGIKRRKNIMKLLFTELNFVVLASIITDYYLGFTKFSITYVLPFAIIAYISCVFILRIFINKLLKDYIFYTYVNCLIGIVPLIFIIREDIIVTWPSTLCILLSAMMMIMLAIFNRKQVQDEFTRKLHF